MHSRHLYSLPVLTAVASLFVAQTSAIQGINCAGSSLCFFYGGVIQYFLNILETTPLPENCTYPSGAHILCSNAETKGTGFCAFAQHVTGGSGAGVAAAEVEGLLDDLQNHGCKVCGSAPFEWGSSANASSRGQGSLTVNFVEDRKGCTGICECPETSS